MRTFVFLLVLFVSGAAFAQSKSAPGDDQKGTLEPKPTQKPLPKLPTPNMAAIEAQREAAAMGKTLSVKDMQKVYAAARQAEIEAIESGHADRVVSEEVESYRAEQKAFLETKELAAARAGCPYDIKIGMREAEVYRCKGQPKHVNDALVGLRQLVYADDLYVYIDVDTGRVENVQFSY